VPLLEGSELLADSGEACRAAEAVGYPVMLKSTAGGGGIGMRVCRDARELIEAFATVQRLGKTTSATAGYFSKNISNAPAIWRCKSSATGGEVIALGVRDCSVQRRNQKVIEETPAPNLPDGMAQALCAAAIALGKAVSYRSAGTVEFVYDSAARQFYFLEVNTRLQVEHGVTEQVWGVDLVRWMIELAAGEPPLPELAAGLRPQGHAIQARIYAEDPGRQFQPSPGLLTDVFSAGGRRSPAYRPLGGSRVRSAAVFRPDAGESDRLAPQPR
jgi:urea carboxylase